MKPRRNPIALAREWDALLQTGRCASRADLARELAVSRARVTQVLRLLALTPSVLEAVADLGDPLPGSGVTEHALRRLVKRTPEEQELWWKSVEVQVTHGER